MPVPAPLLIYQLAVLAFLLALLGITAINLLVLPRIERHLPPGEKAPLVAVLVPARNEEAGIETCLRSLLAQNYPNFEVWLYDDASTDNTGQIAAGIAEQSGGKLHIVTGTDAPPPGWLGKAHALYNLYKVVREHSMPDYLLFTDADVRFEPAALGHAVAAAEAEEAGLLSIFPRQITVTWAERLAVPTLLHCTVYTFLPLPLARSKHTGSAFAAANGQFMLFHREAYEAAGGHTAVRGQILEDVALARAVKQAGYRVVLADGGGLVVTRMYKDASEVWNGYSKNAYAFFGYSPLYLTVGIVALAALYIGPLFFVLYAALSQNWLLFAVSLAQYLAAVAARLLISARFRYRLLDSFLHPLAIAFVIAIELNSMRWALTGKGAWKGRVVGGENKG